MAEVITYVDYLEGARQLGVCDKTFYNLKDAGLIEEQTVKIGSRWRPRYVIPENLKFCLENASRLKMVGRADPIEGHLWVLQTQPATDGKRKYEIVDLGEERGALFTPPGAIKEKRFSTIQGLTRKTSESKKEPRAKTNRKWKLREPRRPAEPPIQAIHIYGIKAHITFERDLVEYAKRIKPTKSIDPAKWGSQQELCDSVGAATLAERCEVSQCRKQWVKMGLLQQKPVRLEVNGTAFGKSTKKNIPADVYDVEKFKELWNRDLGAYAELVKELINRGVVIAKDLRAKLEEKGIVGLRFTRIAKLAGAVVKVTRVGAPKTYVLKHRGPSPGVRYHPRGQTKAWLKKTLADGPLPCFVIMKAARRRGMKAATVDYAFDKLEGRRSHYAGSEVFWCLPGQTEPSPEEAKRILAKHRASKAGRVETPILTSSPISPPSAPATKTPADRTVGLSKVDQAIVIVIREPGLSMREIARRVGCSAAALSQSEAFQRAKDHAQGQSRTRIPNGHKTKEGTVEAEDYRQQNEDD